MKHRSILAAAVIGAAALSTPALAGDVHGTWKTEANDAGAYLHVKIVDCGAKICGEIVKNVNGKKQEIVGRQIITNMVADGENRWDDGDIWKPDTDETYDSEMTLEGDVLKVSGCVLGGLLCRTQDWTRLE